MNAYVYYVIYINSINASGCLFIAIIEIAIALVCLDFWLWFVVRTIVGNVI